MGKGNARAYFEGRIKSAVSKIAPKNKKGVSEMKRFLAMLLLVIMIWISSVGYAKECPLPPVNTDAEIQFSGFEWYSDYNGTMNALKKKGIDPKLGVETFGNDSLPFYAAHWEALYNLLPDSDKGTGGIMTYAYKIPKVAGYEPSELTLYCMYNPKAGYVDDYESAGAIQFYMAVYEIRPNDPEACYKDLVAKLKKLYGDEPYKGKFGFTYPIEYYCWVNNELGMVGVSDGSSVRLMYMAPGAEEKLLQVEELAKKIENENAAGDFTGL